MNTIREQDLGKTLSTPGHLLGLTALQIGSYGDRRQSVLRKIGSPSIVASVPSGIDDCSGAGRKSSGFLDGSSVSEPQLFAYSSVCSAE